MKLSITLFLFSLCFFGSLMAQDFEGIAYYKTHRIVDVKMDSTSNINQGMQQELATLLAAQFQKEFSLHFSKSESLYKEIPSLEKPKPSVSGLNITVSGNSDELYTNIESQILVRASEIMSKPFLIKDSLTSQDWKLEKETKKIGQYSCFKATFSEEYTTQTFNNELTDVEKVTKTRITTAWYTPQIPVSHGPSDYRGLPGLVLEIDDGELSILCTKIVLNPEKPIIIKVPNKGKVVTETEFEAIQDKKNKEMMERYQNNNKKKGDGNQMILRIGG